MQAIHILKVSVAKCCSHAKSTSYVAHVWMLRPNVNSLCLNRSDFRVTRRMSTRVRGDSPGPADCQSSYAMSPKCWI